MDDDLEAEFEWFSKFSARERLNRGLVMMPLPGFPETPSWRAFTMDEYRKWCLDNLPDWLGYHS